MAMRRQPQLERDVNDDAGMFSDNPFDADGGASSPLGGFGPPPPSPGMRTDTDGSDRPDAFFDLSDEEQQQIRDMQKGAIAGDRTSGRELFDHRETTPPTGLPRGMTVQSDDAGYGDGGQDSMGTPSQGFSPNPIAGMRANPTVTQRVGHGGAPSALFSDASGGTPMFGRAGGLMGGGKGALGMNEGGPTPTEMMLKLVRLFQQGGA